VTGSLTGLALSLALAALAFARSRARGGFYDADVYAMTPAVHRGFAFLGLAFAVLFAASLAYAPLLFWAGAAFTLAAVFYLTSYLRGAHEDDD
jgi:predicted membrane channel-forming protein YqfA (hemolysin III family)